MSNSEKWHARLPDTSRRTEWWAPTQGSVVSTELPASAGGGPGLLFLGTPRVDSLASLKRCANFAQFSSGRRSVPAGRHLRMALASL